MSRISYIPLMMILALTATSVRSQSAYPTNYFRSPVDHKILLSGTFGELRSNHFHSGIDIKTNGSKGEEIHAIADGYVSRIKVSTWGFGNTLYITHSNGYVSVYAHLDRFNEGIAAWVKDQHYKKESFELNEFPEKGKMPVKKGEVIGYSGNSGYSFGPHLHFEIREEATQKPLNPLLFGIEVRDHTRPRIQALRIYPFGESSLVDGVNTAKTFSVDGWGEQYRLKGYDTVDVRGPFYLGIRTYDLLDDAANRNGVYSVELLVDDTLVFSYLMERYSFAETRFINSLIDYAAYIREKVRFQKSRVEPNNRLSIYRDVKNNGVVNFPDAGLHQVRYVVRDVKGNTSALSFYVNFENAGLEKEFAISPQRDAHFFNYEQENIFETEEIRFEAPEKAFYDSFIFSYDTASAPEGAFSRLHQIHENTTPIHRYCTLSIRPELLPLEDSLKEKLLLASSNDKGEWESAGGDYENGYVKTRIRDFGGYFVAIDTIPPNIEPLDKKWEGQLKQGRKIRFRVKDDLSGIGEYRGELNGEWLLIQQDAKNDLMFYTVDEHVKPGKNDFILKVIDQKGNESEYRAVWGR